VIRSYVAQGDLLLENRWRGQSGEIDLILRTPDSYVFCEVKRAATFDLAMRRLSSAQMQRIHCAASEYLGQTAEGQLAPVRFDLAIVDGAGAVRILQDAFSHF
jgi:putative endonuclease